MPILKITMNNIDAVTEMLAAAQKKNIRVFCGSVLRGTATKIAPQRSPSGLTLKVIFYGPNRETIHEMDFSDADVFRGPTGIEVTKKELEDLHEILKVKKAVHFLN